MVDGVVSSSRLWSQKEGLFGKCSASSWKLACEATRSVAQWVRSQTPIHGNPEQPSAASRRRYQGIWHWVDASHSGCSIPVNGSFFDSVSSRQPFFAEYNLLGYCRYARGRKVIPSIANREGLTSSSGWSEPMGGHGHGSGRTASMSMC